MAATTTAISTNSGIPKNVATEAAVNPGGSAATGTWWLPATK